MVCIKNIALIACDWRRQFGSSQECKHLVLVAVGTLKGLIDGTPVDECLSYNSSSERSSDWLYVKSCNTNCIRTQQVCFNVKSRCVKTKSSKHTLDAGKSQKGADFTVALLRLDDLYVEILQVVNVKSVLKSDHLSCVIGRIAGRDSKTRFAIENDTRTLVVIAD